MPYDAKAQTTDVILSTWEERDRLHVGLSYRVGKDDSGAPLFDLWDEDCAQAFEDGFLKRGRMRGLSDEDPTLIESALEYADHHGMTKAFEERIAEAVDATADGLLAAYAKAGASSPGPADEDEYDRRERLVPRVVEDAMDAAPLAGISDARRSDIEEYLTSHLGAALPAIEEAPAPGM